MWKRKEQLYCLGKTPQKRVSGQKGLKEAWKLWRVKDRPDKTQKKDLIVLGIAEVLLKAACWICKEQHQKQGLSTSNISGNVTVPPITSAEGCYCSQRCLLNSIKYSSQLNVSLNDCSFFPQMKREAHTYLWYKRDPSGPLRVILPHWSQYQSWRIGAKSFLETEPKQNPQHLQCWKVSKLRINHIPTSTPEKGTKT